jgi:heme-degrading monooxygenase HmoA
MFARVITAQTGAEGVGPVVDLAERQLPAARQRPGFQGFYVLTDEETGKVMTISLWETREQLDAVAGGTAAGIHDQGVAAAGLTSTRLETYEVTVRG